jgi:hypothetical protein
MNNNVIVLTTGLSGSSLVTSFIAQAGYWTGDETVVKDNSTGNYNTYENKRLIELNNQLMKTVSYEYNNDAQFHNQAHIIFERAADNVDSSEYLEFINYCNSKGMWIWKDPRLWITIGFWQSIINKNSTKIILLYRDPLSLWISLQNKRQIVSYSYLKYKESETRNELGNFLERQGLDYFLLCYDKLIEQPDNAISDINQYLNVSLSIDDLERVYKGRLGDKTWNYMKLVLAILIFFKNIHFRRKE